MNRRHLALCGLVALVALSGCLGGGDISEEDLNAEAEYDWDTDTTVAVDLSRSSYTTVVNATNRSTLAVYERDALGTENPVQLSALQFRYPNGTVVNASEGNLSATLTNDRTEIGLPAEEGQVAYTAERTGKSFSTPAYVEGSYSVRLPENSRIGIPLLSAASPGGYATSVDDADRMVVTWEGIESSTVSVRYYLQRDVWLFGGLVAVAFSVGLGGLLYYVRQIRRLEDQRKELGLDVDYEDDPTDEGPPPGMR